MPTVDRDLMKQSLAETAALIKKAAEELAELRQKLAYYEKKERVEKIAQAMEEKGLRPSWGTTREEVVEKLMKMPHEKLAVVEEAVDMAAPDDPLAGVEEEQLESGQPAPDNSFEQYLLDLID